MHSSKMCTVRFSGNPGGRVVCLGSVCPGECLSRGRLPRGVSAGGGGVCLSGVSYQGVSVRGIYTTPVVNRITDRFKNITFAQTSFAGGNKVENYKYTDIESWH